MSMKHSQILCVTPAIISLHVQIVICDIKTRSVSCSVIFLHNKIKTEVDNLQVQAGRYGFLLALFLGI